MFKGLWNMTVEAFIQFCSFFIWIGVMVVFPVGDMIEGLRMVEA